jgi:class 3 adenylate cyclase
MAESNEPQEQFSLRDLQNQRRKIDQAIQGLKRELAVMFCDIKDSTHFFEEFGDLAGHAMVDQFEVTVRRAIEANGGIVFKKMGDGVLSCFEDPINATKAALDMYASLDALNGRAESKMQKIDARAAIHFGLSLVDEEKGRLTDVYGDTVNTTARLQKIASDHGADLVVSKSVADKLVEAQGFQVLDPIEDSAKGKSDPVLACQVVIPGRESARPAAVRSHKATESLTFPRWIAAAAAVVAMAITGYFMVGRNGPQQIANGTATWEPRRPAVTEKTLAALPDSEFDRPRHVFTSSDEDLLEPLAIYPVMLVQRHDPKTGRWRLIEDANNPVMYEDDQFQFIVVPNSDCYAYLIHFTSQGGADLIFPYPEDTSPEAAKLRGGLITMIPQTENGDWWPLDDVPGNEEFYFVASYVPIEDPHDLAAAIGERRATPAKADERPPSTKFASLTVFDELEVNATRRLRGVGRSVREPTLRGIKSATGSKTERVETTLSDGTKVHRSVSLESGSATVVKKFQIRHKARTKNEGARVDLRMTLGTPLS